MMSIYTSTSVPKEKQRHVEDVMQTITPKYMTTKAEKVAPGSPTKEVMLEGGVKVNIGTQLNNKEKHHLV